VSSLAGSAEDDEAGSGPYAELGRLYAFTDGVFAIAATLLVLSLELPAGLDRHDFVRALRDDERPMIADGLSFYLIARFWLGHHRLFGYLEHGDRKVARAGVLMLGPVALVPFASDMLALYGDYAEAAVAYALVVVAIAGTELWIWRHALRARLVRDPLPHRATRGMVAGLVALTAVFLVSIPIGLGAGASWAEASWFLLIPAGGVIRWRLRRG
jgi:uncharacterized membrane protein